MDDSQYMAKAKALINEVRGKTLTIEERREQSIELSALMLNEARRIQTNGERKIQSQLARMMDDPIGKVFTTAMTDQCFRSDSSARVADQLIYLLEKFGVPRFLNYRKQLELRTFKWVGKPLASMIVPLSKRMIRKETSQVILPGEHRQLVSHMQRRRKEGVRINLNRLGEAILGEQEAGNRLQTYLEDLKKPEVEYISVKISTIYSQLNLLASEETLEVLIPRLKELYRAAHQHKYKRPDGKLVPKFVNLDMEEYRDLHLTVDLFRKVLDDPEFYHHSAGLVLQSYLPDSYLLQQEITVWAMRRVANGGAPVKLRIVKGANLAMEQVESSLRKWPQAPYTSKADVDANYKRMVNYGCIREHANAVHLGIASHNLFDIAYAILLRAEMGVEAAVGFEMLEGMADHMRRVVQQLAGDMLLYCPAATQEEFQNAVAYLVRRLDENTAPENFLRHSFGLIPGTKEWQNQANHFSLSCHAANAVGMSPRRTQNRYNEPEMPNLASPFQNEADTDWSLPQNCRWARQLLKEWEAKEWDPVPVVIGGKEIPPKEPCGTGEDPSRPGKELYRYALASPAEAEKALKTAEEARKKWSKTTPLERSELLAKCAQNVRKHRGDLIGAMVGDAGKIVYEADVEISEAIDFVEYYRRELERYAQMEDLSWKPKGTVLVTPPWNFSCAIPLGGVTGALAAGNSVIFKPAREVAYVGWLLVNYLWEAGVPKDVLQFILCEDDPVGSQLVTDPRVSAVVLTGATDTAKLMLQMRPGLDLIAETGGKNAMIITSLADRDLAIKDLVQSAFGHAGQKCSACSLAILEAEVYDDKQFRKQLRDAVASLEVGSAWHPKTKVNPMIQAPGETLMKGLTTLETAESWLLEPKQDPDNPNLWSPGIKLGVTAGSFTHQTELFGPVLGLMRAENLEQAIEFANGTQYGLTSGIHSLDERERKLWREKIEAGNLYINRGITGAIVRRQPFGGTKASSFGLGAKAGGPNYLSQFMEAEQLSLPKDRTPVSGSLNLLTMQVTHLGVSKEKMDLWNASLESYMYHWKKYFSKEHDPSLILGQDNLLSYRPQKQITLRVQREDELFDVLRVIAACEICGAELQISSNPEAVESVGEAQWMKLSTKIHFQLETEAQLIQRIERGELKRIRLLSSPSEKVQEALAHAASNVIEGPVLANGRIELFRYLREESLSADYHRYGNLGIRENESRNL